MIEEETVEDETVEDYMVVDRAVAEDAGNGPGRDGHRRGLGPRSMMQGTHSRGN